MSHSNGILKARPTARASLAELLARLAGEANELRFQARWVANQVDFEGEDRARELLGDSLTMLADASDCLLDLATGVRLGTFRLRELPDDSAARPILDQIEDRAAREGPKPDPITGGPPVRPRPARSATFEVLDRGPGHPGHVQFDAESADEAMRRAAESWPGLEVREVVEPAKMVGKQRGSDGRTKDGDVIVREPVIGSSGLVPDDRPPPNDGRKRFVALNAFKKVMCFVRASSIEWAREKIASLKPNMALDVVEDLEGLGVKSGLDEVTADFDLDVHLVRPDRQGSIGWVGRVRARDHAHGLHLARKIFGDDSAKGNGTYQLSPASAGLTREVEAAGGMKDFDLHGVRVTACCDYPSDEPPPWTPPVSGPSAELPGVIMPEPPALHPLDMSIEAPPKELVRVSGPAALGVRACRSCGCTDEDCRQCIEKTGEPCRWVEQDLCSACAPEPAIPARPLDTDELLLLACNRRAGMAERWEAMRRDGASDLEMRAALSRAFDFGMCDMNGIKAHGGFMVEDGGKCSFKSGDNPGFWAKDERWEGRPTLEGKRLIERARAVLEIPEFAGGPVPKRAAKPKKKPKLFEK